MYRCTEVMFTIEWRKFYNQPKMFFVQATTAEVFPLFRSMVPTLTLTVHPDDVKLPKLPQKSFPSLPHLIINTQRVVFTSARDVIAIGRKSNEVLLVYMSADEWSQAERRFVDVPKLQLSVSSRGDDFVRVEELHVRNGFLVTLKAIKS